MLSLSGTQVLIANDLHEQAWRFPGPRAPDNIASGRGVALVAGLRQPSVKKLVPLMIGAYAKRFEVPAITAIVL